MVEVGGLVAGAAAAVPAREDGLEEQHRLGGVLGQPRGSRAKALEGEETVGHGDERGVVVPADPGAAFVVVESELALELLVVELDLPTQPGEPGGIGVGRKVGDPEADECVGALRPDVDEVLGPGAAAVARLDTAPV